MFSGEFCGSFKNTFFIELFRATFWLFKYIKGRYIKYVSKIFWKTNIPNPLMVRIRELEMLVFRKILRTYLMDDPKVDKNVSRFCNEDIKVASIEATLATLCQLWKRFGMLRKLWKPPSR